MATEGAWTLYENEAGSGERKLVTSDFLDTLERLAVRRREADATRVHRVAMTDRAGSSPGTSPAE